MVKRTTKKLPAKATPEQIAREAERKADLDRRINEFIEWKKEHPSVWDQPQNS